MDDRAASPKIQGESLTGGCPYCLAEIDVHLDVKGRPHWRCGRCEVWFFGTKITYVQLTTSGWIWACGRSSRSGSGSPEVSEL